MEILIKSQKDTQSLSIYGSITLLGGTLLLATLTNGFILLVPLMFATATCVLFSKESFRDLRQIAMLIPMVIVVSTLLWQAEYIDAPSVSASATSLLTGFFVGVEMSLRAVSMVLAVSAFVRTVRLSDLTEVIETATKSKSFSFVFGLALNMKPYLEGIIRDTLNAIKMRGGFRPRNIIASTRYLLSSTTLNALAKCQDISYAAEARAFGSERSIGRSDRRDNLHPSLTDLLIVVATAAIVVISFFLKT